MFIFQISVNVLMPLFIQVIVNERKFNLSFKLMVDKTHEHANNTVPYLYVYVNICLS